MYPPEQARRLFLSSHLTLGSLCCAGYFGLLGFSALAGIVLGTSLLHWHDPKLKGWRRYVDLIWVQIAAVYHLYNSQQCAEPYRTAVYILWPTAIACYANAIRNGLRKDFNRASWFHALGLHFIGNFANCIFYYGVHVLRRG
jgi:hypothetical protein